MRLEEFPPNSVVRRPSWAPGLVAVKLDGTWVYVQNGQVQRALSNERLACSNFYAVNDSVESILKGCKMEKDLNYVGGEYKLVELVTSHGYTVCKMDIDLEVEEGQYVVAETARGSELAHVKCVYDNTPGNYEIALEAKSWVIDVVDSTRHDARKEAHKKFQYVKAQLDERRQQADVFKVYEALAAVDPETKALLEQLKQITQGK